MIRLRSNKAAHIYVGAAATIGWFALSLQLYLMVTDAVSNGRPASLAVLNFFSFFTILTNLLAALGLTLCLCVPRTAAGRFFSRPAVIAGTAVFMFTVGVVYSLLLRHLWNPQGAQKVADVLLHDVAPVMYVGYWLIFAPRAPLRWRSAFAWLLYPLVYFAYSLIRGALSGWYPYPFIDAAALGYPRVLGNAAMLAAAFLALSLLVIKLSRWLEPNAMVLD